MLKKILLTNFQNWKKLAIDFDPYVTSLVGLNGAGKSCVLRALRWVILNDGQDVINWNAKTATVKLVFDDNTLIRSKGEENSYTLNGQKFVAFGTNVPEEIQNLLKITEVNFQDQHDPVYWFSQPAPQVSRELNRVIDLSIIDKTLAKVGSEVKRQKSVTTITEQRLQLARTRRKSLKWVLEFDRKLSKLEKLEAASVSARQKRMETTELLQKAKAAELKAERLLNERLVLENVIELGEQLRSKRKQIKELNEVIASGRQMQLLTQRQIPNISKLESYKDQLIEIRKNQATLRDMIWKIKQQRKELKELKANLSSVEQELQDSFELMKVCPVCERPTE